MERASRNSLALSFTLKRIVMKNKDIKKKLSPKKKKKITGKDFVSTGSTLLNLAITGKPNRGFMKGLYYYLVGDSSSGKTFNSLTCLAEASINKNFDDYRFIYDNSENGALMNIENFFGKGVAKRIESPSTEKGREIFSATIEEFYYHIDDALKEGVPFIYILDSMDSLTSEEDQKKFDEHKKAHRKGNKVPGQMTDGKAKKNSSGIRRLLSPLKRSGSLLIVISQTRANMGGGYAKKSRSGGWALQFYACVEIWTSIRQKLTKTVRGKPRQIGILCQCQTKKNRIKGRDRKVCFPIYHSFGIADIESCIDYLLDEEHWEQKENSIHAPEFKFKGTKKKLIKLIETKNMEKDLREITGDVWNDIEDACAVHRKRRY